MSKIKITPSEKNHVIASKQQRQASAPISDEVVNIIDDENFDKQKIINVQKDCLSIDKDIAKIIANDDDDVVIVQRGIDRFNTDSENNTDTISDDNSAANDDVFTPKKKKKTVAQKRAGKIAKIGIFSALSVLLYMVAKFSVPFLFPSFLDIQVSDIPALIATFAMGIPSGIAVLAVKILVKLPFSTTVYVGELMDFIIGLLYIIPCGLIYRRKKTQKSAVIGLTLGSVLCTAGSMLMNRFVAIPIYLKVMFDGSWTPLINMCKPLFNTINIDNFYNFYIFGSVLPFNLLRCVLVSLFTVLLYKKVSNVLKRF